MWLRKRRTVIGKHRKQQVHAAARSEYRGGPEAESRVKAVLAQLAGRNYIVLATAQSDSGGTGYEIRMGTNNGIYCTCKGWQYDKTGEGCKHLKRFKRQVKPFVVVDDGK